MPLIGVIMTSNSSTELVKCMHCGTKTRIHSSEGTISVCRLCGKPLKSTMEPEHNHIGGTNVNSQHNAMRYTPEQVRRSDNAKKAVKYTGIGCFGIIVIIIIAAIAGSPSGGAPDNHLPYTIGDSESYRIGNENCMKLRVRVQSAQAPSDNELKKVAEAVFYNGNSHYDFVRIWLYPPNGDIYGFAYATIEYTDGERTKYERLGQPSYWN